MHVLTTCDGQREGPFRCAAPCERLNMLWKLIMIARGWEYAHWIRVIQGPDPHALITA